MVPNRIFEPDARFLSRWTFLVSIHNDVVNWRSGKSQDFLSGGRNNAVMSFWCWRLYAKFFREKLHAHVLKLESKWGEQYSVAVCIQLWKHIASSIAAINRLESSLLYVICNKNWSIKQITEWAKSVPNVSANSYINISSSWLILYSGSVFQRFRIINPLWMLEHIQNDW